MSAIFAVTIGDLQDNGSVDGDIWYVSDLIIQCGGSNENYVELANALKQLHDNPSAIVPYDGAHMRRIDDESMVEHLQAHGDKSKVVANAISAICDYMDHQTVKNNRQAIGEMVMNLIGFDGDIATEVVGNYVDDEAKNDADMLSRARSKYPTL